MSGKVMFSEGYGDCRDPGSESRAEFQQRIPTCTPARGCLRPAAYSVKKFRRNTACGIRFQPARKLPHRIVLAGPFSVAGVALMHGCLKTI